jgi:hypothetical protein
MTADADSLCGLDRDTLTERVRSLARDGYGAHEIANILRLHVRLVWRILKSPAADDQHQHEETNI